MLEKEFTIKDVIAMIVSPFAFAAAALLAALSFLEYFRRGFVSLFLDLRVVFLVALVLWAASAWCADKSRRSRTALVATGLILAALTPVLWKMTAPFGRLGLITFAAGILVACLIFAAGISKTNN